MKLKPPLQGRNSNYNVGSEIVIITLRVAKPNFSDEPISCKVFTSNPPTWNFNNATTEVRFRKANNITVEYKIFAFCLLDVLLRQKSRWGPPTRKKNFYKDK